MFTSHPFHSSYGVLSLLLISIPLFKIWMTVRIVCTQNISLTLESFNMVLAISYTILFFLSMTPFCWGVLAAKNYIFIPFSSQNYMNYFDMNSPPLSNFKHWILESISFSTISLNILKFLNASNFFFRQYVAIILV